MEEAYTLFIAKRQILAFLWQKRMLALLGYQPAKHSGIARLFF